MPPAAPTHAVPSEHARTVPAWSTPHHGGAGTTTVAAAAGASQVVLPQRYDQPYWAGRVDALGIGVDHGEGTPTAASLRDAIARALDAEVVSSARSRAAEIRPDGTHDARVARLVHPAWRTRSARQGATMQRALELSLCLGVATGLRSTSGPCTLASSPAPGRSDSGSTVLRGLTVALWAGEFVADKTPWVPPRTDVGPLVARAILGGAVSLVGASRVGAPTAIPTILGAASAVATACVATPIRRAASGRLGILAALAEDALTLALAARVRRRLE